MRMGGLRAADPMSKTHLKTLEGEQLSLKAYLRLHLLSHGCGMIFKPHSSTLVSLETTGWSTTHLLSR